MILFLKNISIEGPGLLQELAEEQGVQTAIIDAGEGMTLPRSLDGIDALVVLGGPMNADDEEKYPFLCEEKNILREAVKRDVPVLGICLGAQLLARSLGAEVRKNACREIGWSEVLIESGGQDDFLFKGLPEVIPVFQWHEDAFEVPEGGILLARSRKCPHQAFRYGRAWGLQFHIEVTASMVREWARAYVPDKLDNPDISEMLMRASEMEAELRTVAESLFSNFLRLLKL